MQISDLAFEFVSSLNQMHNFMQWCLCVFNVNTFFMALSDSPRVSRAKEPQVHAQVDKEGESTEG